MIEFPFMYSRMYDKCMKVIENVNLKRISTYFWINSHKFLCF